jgi:hypothetical protein
MEVEKSLDSDRRDNDKAKLNRRSYLQVIGSAGVATGLGVGATSLTTLGADRVRALSSVPCNIIDDFEDGELSEYDFDRGSSGASITSSLTRSGSNALEISETNTEMMSMEGLDYYPSAGDSFSTWVRGTNGADRINITYGVQSHRNRYFARVNIKQGHIALYRYEDGDATKLADKGISLAEDTWYEVEINWQTDGTHALTLYDDAGSKLSHISGSDSTWRSGGIGYDAYLGDGGTVYFDSVKMTSGREVLEFERVVDGFEDTGLTEYEFDGSSSGVTVVDRPTWGGSGALKVDDVNRELISTSGLDNYPGAGDVFSCWVRGTDGADDVNFTYGVQDHDNRYLIRVDFTNDELALWRHENATSYVLAEQTSGFTLSEDTWYNVEVDWRESGEHVATLSDCTGTQIAQIEATDTMWSSGGIGYDAYLGDGGTVYFDHVSIHEALLDDFEDGDMSEYTGDTGKFTVQTGTTLEQDHTLKATDAPGSIAYSEVTTPRGSEYEAVVLIPSGSDATPAIVGCVQDLSTPSQDCYYAAIDPTNNTLSLYRRERGSSTLLEETSVSVDRGAEYRLALQLKESTIHGILRDSSGNDLAATGEHDQTYYGGHLGLHLESDSPCYFDLLTKRPRAGFADSFEDGDLDEYTGDTSSYTVQSATVLDGQRTLKAEANYVGITNSSVETTRRYGYKCSIRAGSSSDSRPSLLACVQNPDAPMDDCYWVQASPDNNNLNLFRREGGSTTVLDREDTTIEKGTTYQIGIELRERKVKGILYDENEIILAETSFVTDTTFSSGNAGFYTGGSSAPAYYNDLTEIPLTVWDTHTVNVTQTVAEQALNETLTQEVLSELNNPSTSPSKATRENAYTNGEAFQGTGIQIPMEYGNLIVVYDNGTSENVRASLDRSTMPGSLISDLSDSFGWPSSEDAAIINHSDQSELHFTRTVTESEYSDVKSFLADYDDRASEPGNIMVMNNDGGWYRTQYRDKVYDVNESTDSVVYEDEILHSHNECTEENALCAASFAANTYAGYSMTTTCGAVIVTGGASAPACGVSAGIWGISIWSMASACDSAANCE